MAEKPIRLWFFTWNNPPVWNEVVKEVAGWVPKNWAFQVEWVKTKHIQGVVEFHTGIPFGDIKKLNGKIHWEPCGSILCAIKYCTDPKKRYREEFKHLDVSKDWKKWAQVPSGIKVGSQMYYDYCEISERVSQTTPIEYWSYERILSVFGNGPGHDSRLGDPDIHNPP